jgi:hypothetical protein
MKSKARYFVYAITLVYGVILGQVVVHNPVLFPLAIVLLLGGAYIFAIVGIKLDTPKHHTSKRAE